MKVKMKSAAKGLVTESCIVRPIRGDSYLLHLACVRLDLMSLQSVTLGTNEEHCESSSSPSQRTRRQLEAAARLRLMKQPFIVFYLLVIQAPSDSDRDNRLYF